MVMVMLIVFVVNVLMLFAAGQLLGGHRNPIWILVGSLLGALFAGFSMVPGFDFLDQILWRLCSLLLTGVLAFGFSRGALGKILLFALLHLSLGSIADSSNSWTSMLLGAAGIGFACLVLGKGQQLVSVELTYRGQTLQLLALRDTGNTLRDPITGKTVLIVGADIAEKLTGLTPDALRDPVKTMGAVPGLRLIPYKCVGNSGFLLALPIPKAKIGNRQGSTLVALSPNLFGSRYQALTGGKV